jgi:DNA polymerase III delta prime subunit
LAKAKAIAHEQSSNYDITVIDTSEATGIETVKTIISRVSQKPFQSKLNTIIIAEAQTLTEPAQNALLKTLEETPELSQIILTAPSRDSVLATIASRCLEIHLASEEKKPPKVEAGLSLSETLETLEKTGLDREIEKWQHKLNNLSTENKLEPDKLRSLHRYLRTLLKLKKAEKLSVNKKLLNTIAALEQPSKA